MGSAPPTRVSHFTPFVLLLFLSLFLPTTIALSVNLTALLAAYPDLSAFTQLLTTTSVADDLAARSSLTLLAVPNSVLRRRHHHPSSSSSSSATSLDLGLAASSSPYELADVVRYHVLLEYLSPADLRRIPLSGRLVATLYQATGRAAGDLGSVNLTRDAAGAVTVRPSGSSAASSAAAAVVAPVTALPYTISVFAVDALVAPPGTDLAASESQPPLGLNITGVLADGGGFNVAASMLEASGVGAELEREERGAGITVFAPTDEAFAELPGTERVQSLPADRKAAVLRFHVLHSYYPLGSLEGIVNPVQPTLATEGAGAGRYTLNITRVNGSVAIDTGVVQAAITRTVFDQNPVAVFGVSRVLLPREVFGGGGRAAVPAAGVVAAVAPEGPPEVDAPPARLSAPPGLRQDDGSGEGSGAGRAHGGGIVLWWWWCCLEALCLLLLV